MMSAEVTKMVIRYVFGSILVGLVVFSTQPAAATTGQLSLSAGYRVDALDWNIAADFFGTTPNILSELTWDDLQIFEVGAEADPT